MKYRKKPVVIEAMEWTGENLKEIVKFTGFDPSTDYTSWEVYEELTQGSDLKIYTVEGPLHATIGDMIIKGVKGEFYPCKPDIFDMTYEKFFSMN